MREHEAPADHRVRVDPRDPARANHAPLCEYRDSSDPRILKAVLAVTNREDYAWVQCAGCDYGWQVPHFADKSDGKPTS